MLESVFLDNGAFNGEPEERPEVSIPNPGDGCPRCGCRWIEDMECPRCYYEFPDPDAVEDSDPDPCDGEFEVIMECIH